MDFKRVREGQTPMSARAVRGVNSCYHLSLVALRQHRRRDCTHTSSSHPLSPPLAHTLECVAANAQTWIHKQTSHNYRRTPRCLTAIIRNKSRSPAAKIPPFPHTSHYRGLFFASILNQQGFVWSRERPTSWGESQLQVRGSRRAREASQKSSQDEKLAFQIDS